MGLLKCQCEKKCLEQPLFTAFAYQTFLWRQQTFTGEEAKRQYVNQHCAADKKRWIVTGNGRLEVCDQVFRLTLGVGRDMFARQLHRAAGDVPQPRQHRKVQAQLDGISLESPKTKEARGWLTWYSEARGVRMMSSNQEEVWP